jgi:peroxiredoxin
MLPIGYRLPEFSLRNVVDDRVVTSADFDKKPVLVMFLCNHCPYVVHIRQGIVAMARDYESRLGIVAINSNSTKTHPQDGPDHMKKLASEEGWPFPFLFDETQDVAKAFRAACTPEFYLFDNHHALTYRGQFDGARPSNQVPVTGSDLRRAIVAVLTGGTIDLEQYPAIGCNIKWHPGTEPDYYLRK